MNDLIFDRTNSDVTGNKLKGQYNWTDLNRVEKWCRYLADELTAQNIPISITTKTDWTTTDMRTTSDMTRIKNNIVALCNGFTYITRPYSNVTPWRYTTANRWEKVLDELRQFLASMENYSVYSGVANSGQPRLWQNRFHHIYEPPAKDYTPIEYLESTGTQYIDTGVYTRNIEKIVIDFEITKVGVQQYIYGSFSQTPYLSIGLNSSNEFIFYLGDSSSALRSGYYAQIDTRYTMTIDVREGNRVVKLKPAGSSEQTILTSTNANTSTLARRLNYLFAMYRTVESERRPVSMKLYSCQMWSYDVLMRDFVPALNSENKYCLWDKVSETFFLNIGSGEFNPDVRRKCIINGRWCWNINREWRRIRLRKCSIYNA